MPVHIYNDTTRRVRPGPTSSQNSTSAQGCAFWGSERLSPRFWESDSQNWNFGPM